MSFLDLKISESAIQSTGVQSQPDTLTGSAADNKKVFDALPILIIRQFNLLLEALGGTGAASEVPIEPIDGMTAETVQQALAELRQALTAYINLMKSTTGAAQVGVSTISGMTAQNAQAALSELKALIDDLVIGALPPGSVTADMIADDAIVQLGALLAVAAAAAYDPEDSYAVGDYCTHGGVLNKCNTAIPSGEAWNAAHWTETTVAAELADVRASLSNKVPQMLDFPNADLNDVCPSTRAVEFAHTFNPIGNRPNGYSVDSDFALLSMSTNLSAQWINQLLFDVRRPAMFLRCKLNNQWDKWVPIATATPPEVRNLTLQSGFTANGGCTFFVTQESAAFLAGGVEGTMPANQDTQIGTLPADARPSDMCRRSMTTSAGPGYIELRADGTVWAHPFATAAHGWFAAPFVAGGGI